MIVDAHIHLTEDGRWFGTAHDASVDRALREMDKAGIGRAAVIPIADERNRAFCIETALKRSDRFLAAFTAVSLADSELRAFTTSIQQGACAFLKIHPRQSGILPSDPGLEPFLAAADELEVAVTFCSYMRGPRLPMSQLTPLVFDDIARRHPRLKIVLAHAGSYRPLDALAVAQSHPNVYLDISHVLEYFRGSSLETDFRFVIQRLDRKVIYGSDFPEYPIDGYLARTRELIAPLDVDPSRIFASTAVQVYGPPRTEPRAEGDIGTASILTSRGRQQ